MERLVGSRAGKSFREVARVVRCPVPTPGEGQALVRVRYAGVNGGCETFRARADHAFAANKEQGEFLLGAEGAGEVVAVGAGVSLHVGQAVACNSCGFQEFAVVPERLCAAVGEATPQAVAVVLSGVFACVAIDIAGGVQSGQNVLVTAGGGAAGSFAVQFAKLAGARVVTTVGSPEKAALVRSLGADVVINHREVDVAEALRQACPEGFDVVMEGVGGSMFDAAFDNLAPRGKLLVGGYISEYPHTGASAAQHKRDGLPPLSELFWKNQEVVLPNGSCVTSRIWSADPSKVPSARAKAFELFGAGKLQAVVDPHEFVGLDRVSDAVDFMLSGQAIGKVVVKI